jgi:hypothetical protein
MGTIASKIKEELLAVLPPTIFFFVTLHIVAVIHSLMVRGTGIQVATSLEVTIGALILGKAVLIADLLPGINLYPNKPLIYNVVWKTTIYVLVSIAVRYVERLIHAWRVSSGFVEANRKLFTEMVWPHFFAIQILLIAMIFSYCVLRELVRVIGRERVLEIFFGARGAHPSTPGAATPV